MKIQERKTIVIIGAGISGLSAGIYAEQHGFHAIIVEKNPSVGGLCTGWYRKGRYIDGCIHWLTGTKEGTVLNDMWKNVGAFESQDDLIYLPTWGSFEYNGIVVPFYNDLDLAEKTWIEISPVDKKMIHKFFKMVRDFCKVELPVDFPMSLMPLNKILTLGFDVLKVWPSYILSMKESCEHFALKFKSPALRFAICKAQPGPGNLFSMIYSYSTLAKGDGGIPKGGSKLMTERMKDYFISLGGSLFLNQPVRNVLIDNKTAYGVITENEMVIKGDYVVSCLDTQYTLSKLLLGLYNVSSFSSRYLKPFTHDCPSCVLLNFEAPMNFGLPIPYSFECEPFYVGGLLIKHLTIRSYDYDETFCKDEKTIFSILIDQYASNYKYWQNLKDDKEKYYQEKDNIVKMVSKRIINKFPELTNSLNILDIFTPWTINRYVNSSNGSYMSFLFNRHYGMYCHNGHVKGLKSFYLGSQWLQGPGGLPIALMEGKFAIQRICKKENLSIIFNRQKLIKKKS